MNTRLMPSLLSFVFTLSCLFWPGTPAQAANECRGLFSSVERPAFGTLKKSFKHNNKYSFELPEQIDIKNQCNLGTCHLHSWASSLERNFAQRTGEKVNVNMNYLALVHWKEQTFKTMFRKNGKYLDPSETIDVQIGASPLQSQSVIRKFGLIPEEVWKPKVQFHKAPLSSKYEEFIENRIAKMKWDLEREIDPKKKFEIQENAEFDIQQLFDSFGTPPEHFEYNGKEYTPVSFAQEKFPEAFEPVAEVMVHAKRDQPTTHIRYSDGDREILTDLDTVERLAKEVLDSGRSVYLSYQHEHAFVDKKTGIMSISAFDLPNGAGPLTREQRAHFEKFGGGHAVQIIGYDLDPKTGKVAKWKIQNSWGTEAGDQGIYHMYADYFRAFVRRITFAADADVKYPKNEALKPIQYSLPL